MPVLLLKRGKQGEFPGDGASKLGLKGKKGLKIKDAAMETLNASDCDGNGTEEGKA